MAEELRYRGDVELVDGASLFGRLLAPVARSDQSSSCWPHPLKRAFAVTPKSVGGAIPLRRLWMELTMFAGNCVTSAWCLYHLALTHGNIAYAVNGFWATYHAVLLSTLFVYFNRPVTIRPRQAIFRTVPESA